MKKQHMVRADGNTKVMAVRHNKHTIKGDTFHHTEVIYKPTLSKNKPGKSFLKRLAAKAEAEKVEKAAAEGHKLVKVEDNA